MLHDIAIVGAGPVGATLALGLADGDLDVVVLDARARGETLRGERSLALSHGARLILERCGVWTTLAATKDAVTPIIDIDISQARGFGVTQLHASDHDLPALGYVVSYRALQRALDVALQERGIAVRHGVTARGVGGTPAFAAVDVEVAAGAARGAGIEVVTARLAAVADGTGAAVAGVRRQVHDYGQVALIGKVWRSEPQTGTAYERFTPDGPVALLPEGDHYGLVWTATPERAAALLDLDDAAFLAALGRHFGARVGGFVAIADRRTFPLALEFAPTAIATRCVVLGNAAQALHPVAGQGFNLGLRDAAELAQCVLRCVLRSASGANASREAIGGREMLERYARGRRPDRWAGIALTHGLVSVFGNDLPFVRWPRGLALTLLDSVPAAKRAFTRAMLFGMR
jgi:2-octaprenyl-6-methoxyphenol hydroxylase